MTKNKESLYLNYWDVNNWYGWALSQKLPVNGFEWIEDTSQWVLLNHTPISTQLHQPPPSSLQQRQHCKNQNIARDWAISRNLGRKIQSCLFCLKIATHGILEVLIPNLDLDFWNFDFKTHFWATLGQKSQSKMLVKMLILPENWDTWYFGVADSESGLRFLKFRHKNLFLGKFRLKKSKIFEILTEKIIFE